MTRQIQPITVPPGVKLEAARLALAHGCTAEEVIGLAMRELAARLKGCDPGLWRIVDGRWAGVHWVPADPDQ